MHVGKALKVILELCKVEPEPAFENIINMDIELFRVCQRGRQSRYENKEWIGEW